jgi:hypothetical protein
MTKNKDANKAEGVTKPIMVIVEGKTDEKLIPLLFQGLTHSIKANAIKDILDVGEMNGFEHFKKSLDTRFAGDIATGIVRKTLKAIAIIVDGDNVDVETRKQAITIISAFKNNEELYNDFEVQPKEDSPVNTFQTIELKKQGLEIQFGIFILQDVYSGKNKYQDLESFILENSKHKFPKHYKLVTDFKKEIEDTLDKDEIPYVPGHLNKSLFWIYLALHKNMQGLSANHDKEMPKCFELSLEHNNMHVLKKCYDDLKQFLTPQEA